MTKIQAISDPKIVQKLASMIEGMVDKPWHLNSDWIAMKKWVAVPVEKGRHFEEGEAEATAQALQAMGCEECFAIATEPMGEYPHCYRVPATKEGLLDFSSECASLNFVLTPEEQSFAILCTSEDYNVVAGPLAFVERVLGADIQTARRKFLEVASDEWWEGRLLEVARRYEELSSPTDLLSST